MSARSRCLRIRTSLHGSACLRECIHPFLARVPSCACSAGPLHEYGDLHHRVGASRSYATPSLSGMVPSLPSTLCWLALFSGVADYTPAQRPSKALLCEAPAQAKLFPSSTAAGGAAWSSLGLRLAAAGTPKPSPSSARSRAHVPVPRRLRSAPLCKQPRFSGGVASSLLLRKGRSKHVPRAATAHCALCRTSPGSARPPRGRPLDQRASAEPHPGPPARDRLETTSAAAAHHLGTPHRRSRLPGRSKPSGIQEHMPSPARADRARAPEPHDEASRRRSRALHALAQMCGSFLNMPLTIRERRRSPTP